MSTKPIDIAASITDAVEGVTKAWAKKRKAEERSAGARARRYDHMVRQDRFTILEAAWVAMKDAYMKASDNGRLPTRPRQIMYAARPEILELTEKDTLDDRYFTQTLLSDYVAMNPEECHDWDIVWDARGHFTEPHTGHEIALGTLEVREYLGLRAKVTDVVTVDPSMLFPTHGPKHRFNFGTLGTSNRRYSFVNDVPVVDIGLRLQDVEEMGLESEPTDVSGNWWKREETLRRHGATAEEIPLSKPNGSN